MTKGRAIALSEDWGRDWKFETNGKFSGWHDRRGLYSMRHPWEESRTGDFAQVAREVRVPKNWKGPLLLSFFISDSHHGEAYNPSDWSHIVGADIFVGHRFKQVLVNSEVVWERDVADDEAPWSRGWKHLGSPPYRDFYHVVGISDRVKMGETFRLSLRIMDKVGSGTSLPGDVHQAEFWESVDLDRTKANKWFDFTAWWGDVFLVSQREIPGTQITFDNRIRLAVHRVNAEAKAKEKEKSKGRPAPSVLRVKLLIARADCLPGVPYPLWGGVPFPQGLIWDDRQIRLMDDNGAEVPCQVQVCSRWSGDSSIQWAWITTVIASGQRRLVMECGPGVTRKALGAPLSVREGDCRVEIDTGAVKVSIGAQEEESLIGSLCVSNGPECGPVIGLLNQQMLGSVRRYATHCKKVAVEEDGPVRASVRIEGDLLDQKGHRFGPFVARLWAWAGCSLLSLSYRIFQETDQLVAMMDDLLLEVATPFRKEILAGFSTKTFGRALPEGQVQELELLQTGSQSYLVRGKKAERIEEGEHAPGWVDVWGKTDDGRPGGLACGVRWFWQQCPKSLTVTPDRIIIGLFQRRQRDDWDLDTPMYMMTRGEAKRHQVWLLPHEGNAPAELLDQVQRAWNARPHLFNGEWIAKTGVLGNFVQHGPLKFPDMDRFIQSWDDSELGKVRYGIRDFRETAWCQNYRGRGANALLEYFSSGRPQWQEYFEQVMAHNLDVDTIHFEPDHPEWIGAIRQYSPYHTTGGPSGSINSNCQDQFLHFFFTGEPDSLRGATLMADYISRFSADQGRSARQEGWPLAQMAMAFLWTGRPEYRRAGEGFLEFAHLYTHPRRGSYVELHGSFSHRGAVPFMTGYLGYGLIRYHQATGDEKAARLLVALAESVVSETGDGNGGFWYSPNPTHRMWGSPQWSALVGGMLAYSYRLTGDPWFAQQAKLCYDRIVLGGGPSLDMAPLMGEMLSGIEAATSRGDLGKRG